MVTGLVAVRLLWYLYSSFFPVSKPSYNSKESPLPNDNLSIDSVKLCPNSDSIFHLHASPGRYDWIFVNPPNAISPSFPLMYTVPLQVPLHRTVLKNGGIKNMLPDVLSQA